MAWCGLAAGPSRHLIESLLDHAPVCSLCVRDGDSAVVTSAWGPHRCRSRCFGGGDLSRGHHHRLFRHRSTPRREDQTSGVPAEDAVLERAWRCL